MKILYLLKEDPDETIQQLIALQASSHNIKLVELYKLEFSYEELVDLIFAYDQVICW